MKKKYHLFIPYIDNGKDEVICWYDTIEGFKQILNDDKNFSEIVKSNPYCNILNPETMNDKDFWLSEIVKEGFEEKIDKMRL